MSIRNLYGKIKDFLVSSEFWELFVVLIVLVAGLFGFELGRASVLKERTYQQHMALGVTPLAREEGEPGEIAAQLPFVASINGSTYSPVACAAADRINPENKIFFSSEAEAERAGYRANQSC